MRCYFRSAAVKVVALLTLPAAGSQHFLAAGSGGFVPRCWVRVIVNISAVSTSGSIALLSLEIAVLSSSSEFFNMFGTFSPAAIRH
jgi:hypothetical protein